MIFYTPVFFCALGLSLSVFFKNKNWRNLLTANTVPKKRNFKATEFFFEVEANFFGHDLDKIGPQKWSYFLKFEYVGEILTKF